MRRQILPLIAIALVSVSVASSRAAAETAHPLKTLVDQGLVDAMFVDPTGNLVTWDTDSGRGFVLGPRPGAAAPTELSGPPASDLAISSGGQLAFLVDESRTVVIYRKDGTQRSLEVGEELGDLVWLDDRRLAVSPTNGSHRVEVWDAESGKLLQGIDPVEPIGRTPGYHLLRATELAWDMDHHTLHTLDAFTGHYRAYELPEAGAGPTKVKIRAEARVDDPNRGRYERFAAETDRQLLERGEYQGATIWRLSLGLDPEGVAWMVEGCDGSTARILAVGPDGDEHRTTVDTSCCSLKAAPWADALAFYQPVLPGRAGCFDTVPRPRLEPAADRSAWIEVTPLTPGPDVRSRRGAYAPPVLHRLGAQTDTASLVAGLGEGLALVCTGGDRLAVECAQAWIDPETVRAEDLLPSATEDASGLRGRAVTGQVALEGVGVAGASVSLVLAELRSTRHVTLPLALPEGAREPVREVVTGAEGRFHLPALAPGEYRLLLTLPGGRMDRNTTFTVVANGRSRPELSRHEPLDLGPLDFAAGLSLEVIVSGMDGRPVPGSSAGAAQEDPTATDPGTVTLYQVAVDEDGHARIEGLDPALPVTVTCRAPGHDLWRETFDVPPASVPCTVRPLARIAGRVVDEDGEPLSDARLTLTGGSGFSAGAVETASADDDGHFHFDGLEPGRFHLVAASPGRATWNRDLALDTGDSRELGDLVLEAGERWRHRVVARPSARDEAEPVAGAKIAAVDPVEAVVPTTTDVYGEAEMEGPARGPLLLEVRADGFAPRRFRVPEAARSLDAEPHEIVLDPAGWVVAHVWDGTEGAPCVGCRVSLSGPGEPQSLVTDGTGTARSGPLAPGTWRASLARLRGYGAVVTRSGGDDSRTAIVRPGGTTEVRFGEAEESLEIVLAPPPVEAIGWRLMVRDSRGSLRMHPLGADGSVTIVRPKGQALLLLSGPAVTVELATLAEDVADPAVIEPPRGSLTASLPPSAEAPGPSRLDLIDLATGRRTAEIEASPGADLRVPYLRSGTYELRHGTRSLVAVSVIEGQETSLGQLRLE